MNYTSMRHTLGFLSLMALVLVTNACNRQRDTKEATEPEMVAVDPVTIPPQPNPNILPMPDTVVPPPSSERAIPSPPSSADHLSAGEKVRPSSMPSPVTTITLSREYQEGYDNGYDDGEDDALGDNGYGGQYDDACRYKGKKRRDYEEGYEDGYEAGYYDNNELDD